MSYVDYKVTRRLIRPQGCSFESVKLQLLRHIDRWALVLLWVPRKLTPTVSSVPLIIQIELNETVLRVLGSTWYGIRLQC